MLNKLLTKETYQYSEGKLDWKEAIRFASKPLIEKEFITAKYVDKMIEKVEENGPFIHLGKGVAIPHARPEDGVLQTSMSMLRVEKSVDLLNNPEHSISTFIVIASEDNEKHLEALKQLTEILSVDEYVEQLNQSTNFSDIEELLENK